MAALRSLLTVSYRNINTSKPSDFRKCAKNFSTKTPLLSSYDSDGKSYVTILNSEQDAPLMIDSYSMLGFRLNNGLFVVGPIALFPRSILSWNVKDDNDVNKSSLSLFLHLAPKLDVLVVGLSDARNHKLIVDTRKSIYDMMKLSKKGGKMNIEVLPTERAVSTFNFLNSENRFVGAALLPPTHYIPNLDDEYRVAYLTKKKHKGDFVLEER